MLLLCLVCLWQCSLIVLYFSIDSNINIVAEWADEPRPSSNILRLIYQGRFLHGNVTLAGNTIILHYYFVDTAYCWLLWATVYCHIVIVFLNHVMQIWLAWKLNTELLIYCVKCSKCHLHHSAISTAKQGSRISFQAVWHLSWLWLLQ